MDDVSVSVPSAAARSGPTRRPLIASVLGIVGGAGVIGGMWLPLANLAGLGPVGCFDYNHVRAYAYITLASLVIIFSIARCFRIVLVTAGLLCGLLAATGIDLYQTLCEVMSMNDGELSQMARQLVAHSSLQAGAYILPLCGVACIVAGMLGSSPHRPVPTVTSES